MRHFLLGIIVGSTAAILLVHRLGKPDFACMDFGFRDEIDILLESAKEMINR